jgi:hypothetical protein
MTIMTPGIGERHHAEAWARRSAGAVLTRPALLRRSQFRSRQEAAPSLAADGGPFLGFYPQMEIIEARVLAAGQALDQLLLGNRTTHGMGVRDSRAEPSRRNRSDNGV